MKRKELFEFEDFDWFPSVVRSGATNLIMVLHRMMGTSKVIAQLILDVKSKTNFNDVLDLGSGSGGAMIDVAKELAAHDIKISLSDLHPNKKVVEKINKQNRSNLKYNNEPVNASALEKAPQGLKTMIASFHHIKPSEAKNILASAQNNKQPILIFEIAKNNIPFIVWLLFLPVSLLILIIMTLLMTPFVRPLTIQQMFFTYVIPLIPLVYAWDGQASLMRTYTFSDIEKYLLPQTSENYKWEIKEAKKTNGKPLGYYIAGYPA